MASVERGGDGAGGEAAADNGYRAGAYAMLGALMRREPDRALLDRVGGLSAVDPQGELAAAMSALGMAARSMSEEAAKHEYFALFIGIGRGELVPYGSWYLTGFLMERPLGELRSDLARLGFERESSNRDPEDHVGALCEVMAMLAEEDDVLDRQREFFSRHMAPWLERFFQDLSAAKSASFYRAVARFGAAFTEFEKEYLQMQA